jgi:hypothetical protein
LDNGNIFRGGRGNFNSGQSSFLNFNDSGGSWVIGESPGQINSIESFFSSRDEQGIVIGGSGGGGGDSVKGSVSFNNLGLFSAITFCEIESNGISGFVRYTSCCFSIGDYSFSFPSSIIDNSLIEFGVIGIGIESLFSNVKAFNVSHSFVSIGSEVSSGGGSGSSISRFESFPLDFFTSSGVLNFGENSVE